MHPETIGRYEIKSERRHGGMGTVYRAHDPHFKREVAVKMLPREYADDKRFRARFEDEAKTMATLEHAAIVPIYDFGEADGQLYLVMRYMHGGSLADRLADKGPMSLAETTATLRRIAQALDHAHQRGFIHRDVKPANILFDEQGRAYLADFGIAKLNEEASRLSGTKAMGTPAYMSPEQVNSQPLDQRADVYSLAVIVYEMLTGQQPYQADNPVSLAIKHTRDPIPRPSTTIPGLPPVVDAVVARGMSKTAETRFESAGEFVRALEETLKVKVSPPIERPTIIRGAGGLLENEIPYREKGRARRRLVLGALLLGLLALGTVFVYSGYASDVFSRRDEPAPPSRDPVTIVNDPATRPPTATPAATLTIETQATAVPAPPTATMSPSSTNTPAASATPTPSDTPVPTDTATPTLVPSPTSQPAPEVRVTIASANLRAGPGTAYASIGTLFAGDTVTVIATTPGGTWYNVRLANGVTGWLARSVTERANDGDFANIPIAATIPAAPTNTPPPTATSTPVPSPTPLPAASFTPTSVPGPLHFSVFIAWSLHPTVENQAIASVTITAGGGVPPYTYWRDGIVQPGPQFEYTWSTCQPNPVTFTVVDSRGESQTENRFETPPCPDP